jgi:HAD superfamily hydrolase (TIGR01509 family)
MGDITGRLAVRVGDEALAANLVECSEKHYQALLAEGVPVKEGVAELLAWCAEQGRPCAVATSTRTAKAEYKLASTNLRSYFRVVIGGDQVERGKPAPDIYLRAAAALGVVATVCGVFEDSEPGVRAAHAAGAQVVWVPDLAPVDVATQGLVAARADSLRVVAQFLRANRR